MTKRRTLIIGMVGAAVLPAVTYAGPDADLLRACAQHERNLAAYRTAESQGIADDDAYEPLWEAYSETRDAISAAKPQTLEGMLAKARIAKIEALCPNGEEMFENCPASDWAWHLLHDLMRMAEAGRLAEPRRMA